MLVHKYFIKPQDEDSELVALDQIELGHEYFNRLVLSREMWREARRKSGRVDAELRRAASREDRKHFTALGLHFGTYWLIETAAKKAKHPHPRRTWDEGRAGVPIPTSGADKGVLCDHPHRPMLDIQGTVVHLRLAGRTTKWSLNREQFAKRPLPSGGLIVQAWVQRERTSTQLLRNPRYRWFLVLVIDRATLQEFPVSEPRAEAGLDLGWSKDDGDSLRVAYVASDTEHQAIRMLPEHVAAKQFADSLRQIADRECADPLKAELGLNEKTGHTKLVRTYPEDPRTKQLVHLMEWNKGASQNALASRNEHYRKVIHGLCRKYHTIYVEKIKGTPELVGRKKTQVKKNKDGGKKRGQRQAGAPFMFLRKLQSEAKKFGTQVIEVEHAYTSRTCTCGADLGPGSVRERFCDACGQVWDRDHLAALNLLAWGRARNSVVEAAE